MLNRSVKLQDESFTYGKSLRPSTPIKDVISNIYADMGEQQMLMRYQYLKNEPCYPRLQSAMKHTKASALAKSHIKSTLHEEQLSQTRNMFKMKKFLNVAPRTNTHKGSKPK